jgi:ABC-type transporter Mla subunit MlaD
MEYTRTEIRTGLLIVLAAVMAALVIFIVGDFRNLFTSKMHVEAIFDASSGLKPYAGVRYAGVEVGEVRAIRLTRDNPPRVSLDLVVRRDAGQKGGGAIKTLGFLGERYAVDPASEKGPAAGRRPTEGQPRRS